MRGGTSHQIIGGTFVPPTLFCGVGNQGLLSGGLFCFFGERNCGHHFANCHSRGNPEKARYLWGVVG